LKNFKSHIGEPESRTEFNGSLENNIRLWW